MSGDPLDTLSTNLSNVRRRLGAAAHRSGRVVPPRLIAVSKTFPVSDVRRAAALGQQDFGENRVQEGLDKIAATTDLPLTWHLIGHLQSNKARKAAAAFQWIHSIDSVDLLRRVDAGAHDAGTAPQVLIQVDLAGEATKFGAPPDVVREIVDAAQTCRAARLRGLMLIPPAVDDPEDARPWFSQLVALRTSLESDGAPAGILTELSMGMSHDFEVAIDEGATMIRIGTAIFGGRPPATSAP